MISKEEEERRAKGEAHVTENYKAAAIEAIDGVPGGKKKGDAGKKLGEADQSEIEGALGDFVNLPADGDRLHLERRNNTKAGDGEGDKVGIRESGPSRVTIGGSVHLHLLYNDWFSSSNQRGRGRIRAKTLNHSIAWCGDATGQSG